MFTWHMAARDNQQIGETSNQRLHAAGQRRCELAIAVMLLEQDLTIVFENIHYRGPSTCGRMPVALKDVSILV
jgi:hypothetical protein